MNDEITLRKQAVELHLKGFNKTEIAEKLGKSRQWVCINGSEDTFKLEEIHGISLFQQHQAR